MAATAESVLKPDYQVRRKHFIFNDEHEALRESITKFATKELAPHADEWEETTFPDWVFSRMGELGFLGLDKPEQYGGQGGDYFAAMVLGEAIAHANCGGLAMGVAVQTDMAMPPILAFGSEEQKQEWAVPAIKGEKILCLGITEPDAGSDVKGIKTRALRDGDDFVINGPKTSHPEAFGKAIGHFQVIRHKFAEMATKIEAARQLVYATAWRFANGEYPVREISMAKLYASRVAVEVADECIQIHGGAGYMKEYNVERAWRDARLNRIGAGTDEIMLEVIGRSYGL